MLMGITHCGEAAAGCKAPISLAARVGCHLDDVTAMDRKSHSWRALEEICAQDRQLKGRSTGKHGYAITG